MTRTHISAVIPCTVLLCTVVLYAISALPFQRRSSIRPRQEAPDCTTDLSNDLYGLGVRLGIYFQWCSGWVSNNYVVDEVAGGLDANSIFMFAIAIAIFHSTLDRSLSQIDAFIMIQLCVGTIWSVLSIWGYRTCVYRKEGLDAIRRFGGFGTHLRLILGASVSWYSIWFWTVGIQGHPRGLMPFGSPAPETCSTVKVFRVPITGNARYVILSISLASMAYTVPALIVAPLTAITRIRKMCAFSLRGQYDRTTRLRFATGANRFQLYHMSCSFGVFNLIWIVFMINVVELTLNDNYVNAVLGANAGILRPGQLLPMLIGAFSFVRVLFIAFELWRTPSGDISPSLGRASSKRNPSGSSNTPRNSNVLRLFSAGYAQVEDPDDAVIQGHAQNQQVIDPILALQLRLSVFQRVMITWLPWLSLLHFEPWTGEREDSLHKTEKEPLRKQQATSPPRHTRDSAWDGSELSNMDPGYRRSSRYSMDDGQQQESP